MSVVEDLLARSAVCELCSAENELESFSVKEGADEAGSSVLICGTCAAELAQSSNVNHWRCLNDTMWSQVPAVQVAIWRILHNLRGEGWPQDLLDMLYLDEETLAWAQEGISEESSESEVVHRDSNGAQLTDGDSVTLIKDLNVKGGGFTAKRGTIVRGISLVADNAEHFEGRVNGQRIVILTKFVKKVA